LTSLKSTENINLVARVLTIDEDLAVLLEREVVRSGTPLEQTVSRLLRSGLRNQTAPTLETFHVRGAKNVGLPKEWTSGKTEDLLDLLEGTDRRC
jgi:hypothetical protein